MKILIVRTFPDILDPNRYNIQELGLAKALTRMGHTCGIVLYYGKNKDKIEKHLLRCPKEGSPQEGYPQKGQEITIYRLHGYNFLKNGIFPSLKRITEQYDVIQVHEYDQITSWRYYAFSKKPVVIYHGPYYHPFNRGYNLKCRVFDHTFLKLKSNLCVPCLTKSPAAAEFLKTRGFMNTRPVGVGLDTDTFMGKKTETMEKPERFTLLYVGKIEERRNVFFLLKLFEKLEKQDDSIAFQIVGNGEKEYTAEFLRAAEGLTGKGKLTYRLTATQEELGDIYQSASLMVFPTNYDIFGMVLLEAQYFALPVISSHNGGADMLIENGVNGIVMEDFELESWTKEILSLVHDLKKYDRIKENLQNMDTSRLTWDGIAADFMKTYQQISTDKN